MTANTEIKDLSQYGLTLADLYRDALAFNGQIVGNDIFDDGVRMVTLYDGKKDNFYVRIEEVRKTIDADVKVEYIAEKKYEWFATSFAGSRFATVECPIPEVKPKTVTAPKNAYASKNPMSLMNCRTALDFYATLRGVRMTLSETVKDIDGHELEDFDYITLRRLHFNLMEASNDLQTMKDTLVAELDREDTEEVLA